MTAAEHDQAVEQERADLYALVQETDQDVITSALTAHGVDPAEVTLFVGGAE